MVSTDGEVIYIEQALKSNQASFSYGDSFLLLKSDYQHDDQLLNATYNKLAATLPLVILFVTAWLAVFVF